MNIDLPYFAYLLGFALGILFLMVVFIPRGEIQKLFWFSVLCGAGLNLSIEYIFVHIGLTRYEHIIPFNFGVLPIWTVLAWAPAVMLFIYFLPQRKETYIRWMYILLWSIFTWGVAVIFSNLGILVFIKGGPWIWFITGFVCYPFIIKYYRFLGTRSKDC
ncbi:hypothetical protein [Desulfosporosinus metallidurans]|uniref:hypothetical protein n=1 Tax=Desulfosporosinus metallidurans TaxID=1888891 RepID=UPI00094DE020|nr:hypothetical protein [Desulfosporosinus metallidurans]